MWREGGCETKVESFWITLLPNNFFLPSWSIFQYLFICKSSFHIYPRTTVVLLFYCTVISNFASAELPGKLITDSCMLHAAWSYLVSLICSLYRLDIFVNAILIGQQNRGSADLVVIIINYLSMALLGCHFSIFHYIFGILFFSLAEVRWYAVSVFAFFWLAYLN